ncbi:MAG: 2OG-Fe(II) oxygenase [Rhizobiaceae bacterium]|nr:2OG-Fe(II) oxygenase [Rhizobiaceae bacterium]
MTSLNDVKNSVLASFAAAEPHSDPYPYFLVSDVVPEEMLAGLRDLPFPAPELGGVSGTREVHNKSRSYFDADNCQKYDVCKLLAEALQSEVVVAAVQSKFNTDLSDTFLRIEYAQDTDGFWLEPHTDIGVKSFTILLYLSDGEGHDSLGTSIYADKDTHVGESPFVPNLAMIFVPSNDTWHGFEPRPLQGIRKSIIINYVTQDWRAREQLAFPQATVPAGLSA